MPRERPAPLELAYRYLNRRERTVAEVRRHLIGREVEPAEADAAIEELVEQGMLDDARFARLFVEDKRRLERWGSGRIRRGLDAHGLDREVIDVALSEAPAHDELSEALELLRRRFPALPSERRERERALGVLVRKGYEYELALDAIRTHCGSAQ